MRATLCNDEDDMTPGCQLIKTTLVTLKVDYLTRDKPNYSCTGRFERDDKCENRLINDIVVSQGYGYFITSFLFCLVW